MSGPPRGSSLPRARPVVMRRWPPGALSSARRLRKADRLRNRGNGGVAEMPDRIRLWRPLIVTSGSKMEGLRMRVKSRRATVDDMYQVPEGGKAELIEDGLVVMSPTGALPSRASAAIYMSLLRYERATGAGRAFPDNMAFLVDLPGRKSFSPDAAFHRTRSLSMRFVDGAPVFAAEVRSEGDHGPAAEEQITRKRSDYFAAGTLVVWDVDLLSPDVVRAFRADRAEPKVYRPGKNAEAELALPGWRMPVDD